MSLGGGLTLLSSSLSSGGLTLDLFLCLFLLLVTYAWASLLEAAAVLRPEGKEAGTSV